MMIPTNIKKDLFNNIESNIIFKDIDNITIDNISDILLSYFKKLFNELNITSDIIFSYFNTHVNATYNPSTNIIKLNLSFLDNLFKLCKKTSEKIDYNLDVKQEYKEINNIIEDLLSTMNHELRHYYQSKYNKEFKYSFKLNKNSINDDTFKIIKRIMYYCTKHEIDAFSYQLYLKINNKKNKLKLIKKNNIYMIYISILYEKLNGIKNKISIKLFNKLNRLILLSKQRFLKKLINLFNK